MECGSAGGRYLQKICAGQMDGGVRQGVMAPSARSASPSPPAARQCRTIATRATNHWLWTDKFRRFSRTSEWTKHAMGWDIRPLLSKTPLVLSKLERTCVGP
jgi:hypothetical protein